METNQQPPKRYYGSETKEQKEEPKWAFLRRIIFILTLIFLLVLLGTFIWETYRHYEYKNIIEKNIIVEATYKSIVVGSARSWEVYFEYIDENGVKYGDSRGSFSEKENAKKLIGKKLKIYIDGKGTCVVVGSNPIPNIMTGISIGIFILTIGDIVLFAILKKKLG